MTLTHRLTEEFLAFNHPKVDGSWLVAQGISSDATIGNIADDLVKNTKEGRYMVTLSIELECIGDLEGTGHP